MQSRQDLREKTDVGWKERIVKLVAQYNNKAVTGFGRSAKRMVRSKEEQERLEQTSVN
jgi:hypothetical protein